MNYIEFNFETGGSDQSDQLIALLGDNEFEGFEETVQYLKAFIKEEIFNEAAFNSFEKF